MIRNGGRLNFIGIDKAAHGFGFGFGSGSGTSSPSVAVTTPGPRRRLKCSAAGFNQYAVLGLSPFASKSDVKHAYKRLALKYHPDVVRGDTGSEKNEMFREIKSAYEAKLIAARARGGRMEMLGDEEEEAPTELNTINISGGFLVVSTDKLSVQYTVVNLHGHDVGVIQSNRPAPVKRLMYFFEMYVKNAGSKGQVAIGFTIESFKMRRQPGWEANSYGYHGDDGLLYRGQGKGEPFGPTFTTGDTVGAGINYASQEIFFAKNGVIVGTVYKDVKGALFPTVAVHSQNEEVSVNFGKGQFVFDIRAYEAQERANQQNMIEKISLPQNVSYGIVRSYLLHYGYEETLNSFELANKNSVPPVTISQENGFAEQDSLYALSQRKTLRQLIRSGNIDSTFNKLRQWYPQTVQDNKSATCFLLHCQKFIELVRVGELEQAVKYGKNELETFFDMESFKELLKDCVALLAYEEPQKSSIGYLLECSQREVVADAVNSMVLATNPNLNGSEVCLHSYLEKLIRQLTACCLERRALNGGQCEVFNLQRVLTIGKVGKN